MQGSSPRQAGSRTHCRFGPAGVGGSFGAGRCHGSSQSLAGRPAFPSFLPFLTEVVNNVSLQRKTNNADEKEYLIFYFLLN